MVIISDHKKRAVVKNKKTGLCQDLRPLRAKQGHLRDKRHQVANTDTFRWYATEIEKIPPIEIKNTLYDLCIWVANRNKPIFNVVWWFNKVLYGWKTRNERVGRDSQDIFHDMNTLLKKWQKNEHPPEGSKGST